MKYLRMRFMAFPAYAGMFLGVACERSAFKRFPRVCGDVSVGKVAELNWALLSPRMRGCFLFLVTLQCSCGAFPAYAGMFPIPLAVACV